MGWVPSRTLNTVTKATHSAVAITAVMVSAGVNSDAAGDQSGGV